MPTAAPAAHGRRPWPVRACAPGAADDALGGSGDPPALAAAGTLRDVTAPTGRAPTGTFSGAPATADTAGPSAAAGARRLRLAAPASAR